MIGTSCEGLIVLGVCVQEVDYFIRSNLFLIMRVGIQTVCVHAACESVCVYLVCAFVLCVCACMCVCVYVCVRACVCVCVCIILLNYPLLFLSLALRGNTLKQLEKEVL